MRILKTGMLALSMLSTFAAAEARDLKFITIKIAPWAFEDPETKKPIGAFPSIVDELEKRTGHSLAISMTPFARIDRELEAGTQDCTIIVWNEERGRIVHKGALVSDHLMGVIARKDLKLEEYGDLQAMTISVLRGLALNERFDSDDSLKKDFDRDYEMGIDKIHHNRLDAIAGAIPTIQYVAKQKGYDKDLGDQLVLGTLPLVLQCSKKSKNLDLLPEFNKAIEDMRADGTIDRLRDEFYF